MVYQMKIEAATRLKLHKQVTAADPYPQGRGDNPKGEYLQEMNKHEKSLDEPIKEAEREGDRNRKEKLEQDKKRTKVSQENLKKNLG
jgi:hypothetical protein